MRILAIRGENLASLWGPFQLPLDEAPIAGTGLFSIAGPTGAGKSTLLDALCLALYGKTPRLRDHAGGRKVMVGWSEDGELLDMNDARALVSRGAASAFAEVDYEGVDRRRYRATWRVHRARRRAEGALQAQGMTVQDLDTGEVLAEKVSQAVAENERAVGFTFDEFKRAVVLPQFEFTNFLRATADERASILERVTGTGVYTRLSQAAHARAAREVAERDGLSKEAGVIAVLDDDARAALEARGEQLRRRQAEAAEAVKVAAGEEAWHGRAAELARSVVEARAARDAAAAELAAAAPLRAELAAAETAEPHRAALAAADAAERRVAHAEGARAKALEGRAAADAARSAAAAAEAAAAAAVARAARAEEAARPELDDARRLDRDVAEARRRVEETATAQARAREEERSAAAALAEAERGIALARTSRDRAAAWLAAHAAERPLAAEWGRWERRLADHAAVSAELARVESSVAPLREKAERAGASLAASAAGEALRAAEAERTRAAAAEADLAAAARDPRALAAEVSRLGERRAALLELWRAAEDAAKALARREAARAEAARASAEVADAGADVAAREVETAAADAALATERAALRRIEQTLDLAGRRAELEAGAPCPLCGATEHPYAHGAPAAALVEAQRAAVAAAEAGAREAALRREDAARRRALAAARGEAAARAAADADAERAAHAAAFGAARERLGEAALVVSGDAETAAEAVKALGVEARQALEAAQAAQAVAARLAESARAARVAADEARAAHERAHRDHGAAERAAAEARQLAGAAAAEAGRLGQDRARIEDELAPALDAERGWREAAREGGPAFGASCARRAAAFLAEQAGLAGAEQALAAAAAAIEAERARLAERRARAAETDAAAARADGLRAEAEAARSKVLAGRGAAEVEAALRRAVAEARAALDLARGGLDAAAGGAAAAAQAVAGEEAALAAAGAERDAAEVVLGAALASLEIDRAALAARLARAAGWMALTRASLDALRARAETAAAVLADRERQGSDHASSAPASTPEEARARREVAGADLAQAADDLSDVRVALQRDAEARARHAELSGRIERQRAIAVRWERLAAVIGSADGKKLRVFAQGLALDHLLDAANVHLVELARRYRLMRVPGADLELQVVDQDLGDEVRTVNGLSGGELFLVSLALALGLASLSTKAVHARTLFIDEGFGTLDRDTLEHAMSALEGLRATGRTIGVISHVPELHERIGVQVTIERVSAGRSRVVLPEV